MNSGLDRDVDFHVEASNFGRDIRLWLFREAMVSHDIVNMIAKPIVIEEVAAGDLIHEPTMSMHKNAAQRLMDALWKAGLRPNNGEASDAQVAAIKAHLEDMRRLVFGKETRCP